MQIISHKKKFCGCNKFHDDIGRFFRFFHACNRQDHLKQRYHPLVLVRMMVLLSSSSIFRPFTEQSLSPMLMTWGFWSKTVNNFSDVYVQDCHQQFVIKFRHQNQ